MSRPILDFEKAHQVALAENPESKDGFEMWRDLERQAQAAVSPLLAEIKTLQARVSELTEQRDALVEGDGTTRAEAQKLREALTAIEWIPDDVNGHGGQFCPACGNVKVAGHSADCPTRKALGGS